MEGVLNLDTIIIALESATYGVKARKALAREGIKSKLIKIDSSKLNRGCGYALRVNSVDFFAAVAILRDINIPYTALNTPI